MGAPSGRRPVPALTSALSVTQAIPQPGSPEDIRRYEALVEILHRRTTARRFAPGADVPRQHYQMILEAARVAPSGANAQPWHFVVLSSPWTKRVIADYLTDEERKQQKRGKATPIDYRAVETAPGCILIVADFRMSWAYPGLMDGTELDQSYHAQAERIILQSIAASTTAAHFAAAALGYQSWWISLIGKTETVGALHPLLGIPEDLAITDLLLFGRAAAPQRRRWKKTLGEVASWDHFDMANFRSVEQIEEWMRDSGRPGAPRPAIEGTAASVTTRGSLLLDDGMIRRK